MEHRPRLNAGRPTKKAVCLGSTGELTMQSQTEVWRSRVSSSLGIVLGAAVAAAAVAWTGTAEAQTKTLKMQSTWPASLTLQDNFKFFGERVEKLTGGTLKIETHGCRPDRAAVRDPGRHQQEGDRWRPRHLLLLGRQEQSRHAVLQHAGRHRRHGPDGLPRLDLRGRRPRDVVGLLPEGPQAQRRGLPDPAVEPAGARLVQEADPERSRTSRA